MKRRIGWTGLAVSGTVLLFLLFSSLFTPPWQDNYRDIALDWLSGILGIMFVRRGLWLRVCARSY
ncbi:MAG: hypothetical protein ACE5GG_03100, partial [Candidatus Omnitrophota bacterium]